MMKKTFDQVQDSSHQASDLVRSPRYPLRRATFWAALHVYEGRLGSRFSTREMRNPVTQRTSHPCEEIMYSPPSSLPPGWEECSDPRAGRSYYKNHVTKVIFISSMLRGGLACSDNAVGEACIFVSDADSCANISCASLCFFVASRMGRTC